MSWIFLFFWSPEGAPLVAKSVCEEEEEGGKTPYYFLPTVIRLSPLILSPPPYFWQTKGRKSRQREGNRGSVGRQLWKRRQGLALRPRGRRRRRGKSKRSESWRSEPGRANEPRSAGGAALRLRMLPAIAGASRQEGDRAGMMMMG